MRNKYIGFGLLLSCLLVACGNETPATQLVAEGEYTEIVEEDNEIVPETLLFNEISDFESTGVIYYKGNPEKYNQSATCFVDFGEVESLTEATSKTYTLPVKLTMEALYSSDCVEYAGVITPSIEICDKNTEVIFTAEEVIEDSGYSCSGTIESNNKSVPVSLNCQCTYIEGNWQDNGNGGFVKSEEFDVLYKITVPSDYDGLAMKITPIEGYAEYLSMQEAGYQYISDYMPENTKIFEIK